MATFKRVKTSNDAQWFCHIARARVHGDTYLKIERNKERYWPRIGLGLDVTIAKPDDANRRRI
jgi:hypothetical protein